MKRNFIFLLFSTLPLFLTAQQLKSITKKFQNKNSIEIEYTVLKKKKYVKHGAYKIYFAKIFYD